MKFSAEVTEVIVKKVATMPEVLFAYPPDTVFSLSSGKVKFILVELLSQTDDLKYMIFSSGEINHRLCAESLYEIITGKRDIRINPYIVHVLGGGLIWKEGNIIFVRGKSYAYGAPDWEKVKKILRSEYPECKINVPSSWNW
jgi:hypothetical protein